MLTSNYESPEGGYHSGNSEPKGFGHLGVTLESASLLKELCDKLDKEGCQFVKKLDEGTMKGIAFVKDPDGYWIELLVKGGQF